MRFLMKKYFISISVSGLLLLGQMSFASPNEGMTACFEQGYETGVKYHNTGNKSLLNLSTHTCCKNPQHSKCNSYQNGINFVKKFGPGKTPMYRQMRMEIMMLETM